MSTTTICNRCGECLVNPDLPCGFCVAGRRRGAVLNLLAAATSSSDAALCARADAIDTLHNLGHSRKEVLQARAQALDGQPADQILEVLLAGVGDTGAVAA